MNPALREPPAILLTCVGKRYDIVAAFGDVGRVVATDGNPMAPAQYAADERAIVPPVADETYVSTLVDLCVRHGVTGVVPLTDLDIEILAAARDRFESVGALLFTPDARVCKETGDKYLAHLRFLHDGLPSPPTFLPEDLPDDVRYPVLIKPRFGSGARNIHVAADRSQVEFFVEYVPEPVMIQTFMNGDQFSVDILCDLEGRCINAIPRNMLESRGGESIKGFTVRDEELIELGRTVGEVLPVKGPATVQCFRDSEYGMGITDVNCRFGGAFPAPMYAGGRYPELIARMARGEPVEPMVGRYRDNVAFSRYFWHLELAADESGLKPTGRDFIPGGPPDPT